MIIPYQQYYQEGPMALKPGDATVLKVCAVRGFNRDWSAYKGLSTATDEELLETGDKLSEAAAKALFPAMDWAKLTYRP